MELNKSALPVAYSAVVSTTNMDRSPLLSAVVPVLVGGLRLMLDLPRQSTTARNLAWTDECVINLPDAETVAAIEHLAQAVTSIESSCDLKFSPIAVGGRLTLAHMTLVPSEVVSALRALECPMQFEARIQGRIHGVEHQRVVPWGKSRTFGLDILRVHLNPSVVLDGIQPNMWTPLMERLREAYSASSAK